jgi:heavy metal translocating P-type ATPase
MLAVAAVMFAIGGGTWFEGHRVLARGIWATTAAAGVVPALWWVIDALRQRRAGVDLMALLALIGALAVREYFAGALIAVMLATGRTLEARAGARARREMHALLDRAPRTAHRYQDGQLTEPDLDAIEVGDLLLVKPGEVVPVDGRVESGVAVLDESSLTGESVPVEHTPGADVRSGAVNQGAPFDLRATTTARDSTYAGVVRLVSEAQASTAPFVRLADRYAGIFVVVSLMLAGIAWAVTGDLRRAVAVLVVATPCPLILAAPVAIVGGLSRAAQRGVMVKGGGPLERLAAARTLLLDKTGTLTAGAPVVADVVSTTERPANEVLRLAASLDQFSPHVLASAIVRAAHERELVLERPDDVEEVPGAGARGRVGGQVISVGKATWAGATANQSAVHRIRRRAARDGAPVVFVGVDGELIGAVLIDDPIRTDAARTIRQLRRDGIHRVVMVTGDREDVARSIAAVVGVDDVLAERTPAEKVDAVRRESQMAPTVMVGDGVNDAPALAIAGCGVAIGARGATASSEAADVVLTVDRLDRLGEALTVARRSHRIAEQSVVTGIGLSVVAMVVAALGWLPPALGALTQEGIDVAVILNALRSRRAGEPRTRLTGPDAELARRFSAEHRLLRPVIDRLRDVADQLGHVEAGPASAMVREVHELLVEQVQPHEEAEDALLYPVLARVLGGTDPTGTMSRAHAEIAHLIRRLGGILDEMDGQEPAPDDVIELRRVLYGLHAILRLHASQEDEGYLSLVDDEPVVAGHAP